MSADLISRTVAVTRIEDRIIGADQPAVIAGLKQAKDAIESQVSHPTKQPMRLFTVTVESSELQDDWNDLYYVTAKDEGQAKAIAELRLLSERPEARINTEATEAHEYRGEAKVLSSFNPDEED